MSMHQQIEHKLQALNPLWLEVENESHRHHVPVNAETHFRVVIVSDAFHGQSRVVRQRNVYHLLAEELTGSLHALALRLFTPAEWQAQRTVAPTPDCRGGHSLG